MATDTKDEFIWAAVLHLGANMWDDYLADPTSGEKLSGPAGKPSRYKNHLFSDEDVWRRTCFGAAAYRFNTVIVDLGDAMTFPSHPELAVPGSWSAEKMRAEVARLKSLGLEPIPKLNFSTCHDGWLKEYGRMISTPKYYEVVADVIRDVCEAFDRPRFFHIGYDEEVADMQKNTFLVVTRRGDLWWHDLNYTVAQVEKHGAQAMMWSDAMWHNREEYLKRMSHGIIQQNWYYDPIFDPAKLKKDSPVYKKRLAQLTSFKALQDGGFVQIPCTSNYYNTESCDPFVKYCLEELDPKLLKGLCTAPWQMSRNWKGHDSEGLCLAELSRFGAAHAKYRP